MKSLFSGIMAIGMFLASFAASVETQVEQQAVAATSTANSFVAPAYNVFGKTIVQPAREVLLDAASESEAYKLVCVSKPDKDCGPCKRQHPIIDQLKKEGYDAKIVLVKDYSGPESISGTPTLLFYDGDKLVKKNKGIMSYDSITKVLKKPTIVK